MKRRVHSHLTKRARKILLEEGAEPTELERWNSEQSDVRFDASIHEEIIAFIRRHAVLSVVAADRILGCPHEEGIDYPEGKTCPKCLFWATRDRCTGETVH